MSKLRERMEQDLELGGYMPGTRRHYVRAVERLCLHYHRSPDRLGQDDLRSYVEHLRESKTGASVLKVQMAGIRFFYATTLGHPELVAWMSWPRQPSKLPVVLSGSEVESLFAAMSNPMFRAIAMVMYGAGLRVSEACVLEVTDIDSARGLLHIRHGKGDWPGLRSDWLMDEDWFPVCSPALAVRLGPDPSPRALLGQKLTVINTEMRNWQSWFEAAGVDFDPGLPFIAVDTLAVALELALTGDAIALVNGPFVESDLASGRLVRPVAHTLICPGEWGLICRADQKDDIRIRTFIDWFAAR